MKLALLWHTLSRKRACQQTGASKQAIVELEGERLLTRASPEVDAALAAMLYVEQPERRTLAESLWDSALQLDTRLSSLDFVSNARRSASHVSCECMVQSAMQVFVLHMQCAVCRWPPRLVSALNRFLLLS